MLCSTLQYFVVRSSTLCASHQNKGHVQKWEVEMKWEVFNKSQTIPKGLEAHFSAGSYIRTLAFETSGTALCGTTDLVYEYSAFRSLPKFKVQSSYPSMLDLRDSEAQRVEKVGVCRIRSAYSHWAPVLQKSTNANPVRWKDINLCFVAPQR